MVFAEHGKRRENAAHALRLLQTTRNSYCMSSSGAQRAMSNQAPMPSERSAGSRDTVQIEPQHGGGHEHAMEPRQTQR